MFELKIEFSIELTSGKCGAEVFEKKLDVTMFGE